AGHRHFAAYDLHREIRAMRRELEVSFRRRPNTWELVSEVVRRAEAGDATTGTLAELHAAYQSLAAARPQEVGARARLAEQVFRLGASVCVDGCRGCLHRSSPLMPDAQSAVLVSRDLLARYREFVLEPGTAEAIGGEAANAIARALAGKGFC